MSLGLAQLAYGMWAVRSNAAAAPIFRASESCQLRALDSAETSAGGACQIESAIVLARNSHSSRHGTSYSLVTVSPDGRRDDTPLVGYAGTSFWVRVIPTQQIKVQRFVAPGYHLSGNVTAFADPVGSIMTRYNPDSGAYYDGVNALLGGLIFAVGIALLVKTR
jgi:hypothetical protein